MRLNEAGINLVKETFNTVCSRGVKWKFDRIVEEIERRMLLLNSKSYVIREYYTISNTPHLIKFYDEHFETERGGDKNEK
jgi:intein-encoded DNA endonuclease-like protein